MLGGSQEPSSMQSIFIASPAFGSSASSNSAVSFSTFGTPSFSSGSSFFNQNSDSLSQQTQSSSANQISGSSAVFAPSTQSAFGNNASPFSTMHNSVASSSGFTSHPTFSFAPSLNTFKFENSDGHESLNSKPIFGQPNSEIGTNAELGSGSFSSGSSFFNNKVGSLCQQAQSSSSTNRISGSSAVFGSSSQSTFGNHGALFSSMHNSIVPFPGFTGRAVSFASAPSFTTFKFGKSAGHESLDSQSILGQINSVIDTNRELATRSFSSVKNLGFCPSATKSQCQGSGVASYAATPEVNGILSDKIISISAMATYKDKSHEELRLKDYQLSWGKANHISGPFTVFGPSSQSTFINSNARSIEKRRKPQNMASMVSNKEFGPSAIQCQWQGSRVSPYAATPEAGSNVSSPTSAEIISISAMPAYECKSHEELKFEDYLLTRGKGHFISENQLEAGLFTSTTRNLGSGSTSQFSSSMNNIISPNLQFLEPSVRTANALSELTLAQNPPDMLKQTSTGLWHQPVIGPLSRTELTSTSNPTPISISNQPSPDPSAGTGSLKINVQVSAAQSNLTIGWSPVTDPFGGEPTAKISVDCPVSNMTIQYGISSLSVNDNPSTTERRHSVTVRNLSLNRNRQTVVKYKPERYHKKVPFFEEGLPDVCKFKAPFIPRGNPRDWLLHPNEEQSTETKTRKSPVLEDKSTGISNEASTEKDGDSSPQFVVSLNGIFDDNNRQEGKMHVISQGNQADEDASVYAHVPDVERIMPKLQCPEYYTIPPIDELAAKEKTKPGFCHHVKDFVVGKYGYGSITFLGATDVTNLDLESIVKFNFREVIVYMDEIKKPPVGQGLNKPAEISLLNVKCIDKNTGRLYIDGPMVDKYKQKLIKKGAEQGAEFVSYDPASGEWKFRVLHF